MLAAVEEIKVIHERNRFKEHPLKRTALMYLAEALLRSEYEECLEMIAVAREFGATDIEIENVLTLYVK